MQMLYHKYITVASCTPLDPNQYSWGENYAGSSGLMSVSPEMNPMQRARSGTVSLQRKQSAIGYEDLKLGPHVPQGAT